MNSNYKLEIRYSRINYLRNHLQFSYRNDSLSLLVIIIYFPDPNQIIHHILKLMNYRQHAISVIKINIYFNSFSNMCL